MEYLCKERPSGAVRAVLFDFDGTISTLRCGWEQTMKPLMLEMIFGSKGPYAPELEKEVDDYIDESTGIQTIHQMKWLAEQVAARNPAGNLPDDPWWYKAEYNRRLMETVSKRLDDLDHHRAPRENYLIAGSEDFLKALKARGVKLYIASGTDHPDVVHEASALGLADLFDRIAGAPVAAESCSKEKVLRELIETEGLSGSDVAVVGDGKVEIALGRAAGARTLGLATDEVRLCGVNPVKRARLAKAGADVIAGDFTKPTELMEFLGLE